MGYLHIENLYKNQYILLFRECYALEKIHGTSAHISFKEKKLSFFSGGEPHEKFKALFNVAELAEKLKNIQQIYIYGEAYGGKQQGMSGTYGKNLKFVAFDVLVGNNWLEVPNAEGLVKSLDLEFVDYVKIPTDMDAIEAQKLRPSVQSVRNGILEPKKREGIVLRPLIELVTKRGERIISKHKNDDFRETKTVREVSPEKLKILQESKAIADEWVTDMRLSHVLQNFPNAGMDNISEIIKAMIEDIRREANGEIVESKEAYRAIGTATAKMFKVRISEKLNEKN